MVKAMAKQDSSKDSEDAHMSGNDAASSNSELNSL